VSGIGKAAAIFAVAISICAFVLALVGGSVLYATQGVLQALVPSGRTDLGYPLGAGVLLVYALGLGAGLAAMRWPFPAAFAMLPLAGCAFLFGGPIAKAFAVVIACCAGFLMVSARRSQRAKAT
jgi:hypothetical protein